MENLDIQWVRIETFTKIHNFTFENVSESLQWATPPYGQDKKCFTMTLPNSITTEGISSIEFESEPFQKLYIHQKGLFHTDMTGSSPAGLYSEFSKMTVEHEILNVLNYDGELCIDNTNYSYDQCRQDIIFKVKTNEEKKYFFKSTHIYYYITNYSLF